MLSSTVRRHSAEDRSFLQQRIALFGKSLFLFFLTIGGVGTTLVALLVPSFAQHFPTFPIYIVAILAVGALWLICRRGSHSFAVLITLDAATTIIAGAATASIIVQAPPEVPFGVPSTLFLTYLLVARAIVVPTDLRHTLAVSVLAALPTVGTIAFIGSHAPGPLTPNLVVLPIWCGMAVLLATWASLVIYNLRRSVREAQQLGQYTLEDKIGEGGMGVVFRARHALLRRPTVIKLLPLDKAGEANLARFEREVQLTSKLSSPNTVQVYDFGRTDEGVFYYAMEHLDGIDLEQLALEAGPQSAARTIHVLLQVCTALTEAHEAGLIHRDVKPSNVMLCRHGGSYDVVKVLDFGLVKDLSGDGNVAVTRTEAVLGTPLYVSPEAIVEPSQVDARSDLYAVGALGYHLLTARSVFDGRTVAEVYARHLYSEPEPPSRHVPGIPGDLERLLLACLSKKAAERPASARELKKALLACADAGRWSEDDAKAFWAGRAGVQAAAAERKAG